MRVFRTTLLVAALLVLALFLGPSTEAQSPVGLPVRVETFASPYSGGPDLLYAEYSPTDGPNFACVFQGGYNNRTCFLAK